MENKLHSLILHLVFGVSKRTSAEVRLTAAICNDAHRARSVCQMFKASELTITTPGKEDSKSTVD